MNNGDTWVKLWRSLITKPIWLKSTPEQKSVLITLLLMANHQESEWEWKGEKFKVEPGEFVTSLESIKKKAGLGISIQNVRSSLTRFKKLEFLTYKSTKSGRVINIINWHTYQPLIETPQQSTQQRGNKDPTTNKKVIKIKKTFTPPTEEEVMNYFDQEGYKRSAGSSAFRYYRDGDWTDSKGNKVLSWKQKMRGVWFKPENKKPQEIRKAFI